MGFDMWQDFARKNSPNHHVVQTILSQIVHVPSAHTAGERHVLIILYQIIVRPDKDRPEIFVWWDVIQEF